MTYFLFLGRLLHQTTQAKVLQNSHIFAWGNQKPKTQKYCGILDTPNQFSNNNMKMGGMVAHW